MDYATYARAFLAHQTVAEVDVFTELEEGSRRFPLLRARTPGRRRLLVTAGFHGDETAGPLTLLEHLRDLVAYAGSKDVGLDIYPCVNPSGFDARSRYNQAGENPNNDFLRYEIEPGTWTDVLPLGGRFIRHEVFRDGPRETRALLAELERLPLPAAALDIHQDPWTPGGLAYAYTLGARAAYEDLAAATGRHLPVARNVEVDEGIHTDRDGLIELHDGSITDYFHRRGVRYTAALETTTEAAMDRCHDVNLTWLRGFVDLAATP